MVVNFRTREISRNERKLARIPMLIKKEEEEENHSIHGRQMIRENTRLKN